MDENSYDMMCRQMVELDKEFKEEVSNIGYSVLVEIHEPESKLRWMLKRLSLLMDELRSEDSKKVSGEREYTAYCKRMAMNGSLLELDWALEGIAQRAERRGAGGVSGGGSA